MPKYLCDYCDVHLNFDSQSGRKQHNRGRKHQENVRGYYAQYAAALAQANREAAANGMAPVTYGITLLPPSQTAGASLRPTAQPFSPYPTSSGPPPGSAHQGPLAIRTLGPAVGNGPMGPGTGAPRMMPPGGFGAGPYQPPPHFGGAIGMGQGQQPPGSYRGPPPPMGMQMQGGMQQQQQPGGAGGMPRPGLPPPPFMMGGGGLPPPPAPGGARPAGAPAAGGAYPPPPQQQQQPQQSQQQQQPPPQQQQPGAPAPAAGPKTFVNPDRMRALGLQDHR